MNFTKVTYFVHVLHVFIKNIACTNNLSSLDFENVVTLFFLSNHRNCKLYQGTQRATLTMGNLDYCFIAVVSAGNAVSDTNILIVIF